MNKYLKRYLWLVIPGLSGFLLFYIIPFFVSIYYSMIDNIFNMEFVGLKNYFKLFNNEYFRLALLNTFQFTSIAVPLILLISFICSILLMHYVNKMKFVRLAVLIPVLVPSAAIVLTWNIIFGENSYLITKVMGLSVIDESQFYKVPVLLFFIWKNAGYNIILFIAGLVRIPKAIYESAELDGANTLKKHVYLTVPLLLPTIFFVLIISIVNSFKIFKETYLLYGNYPKKSIYFIQHYMNNHFDKMNYENITTCATIFAVIVCVFIIILYKSENKLSKGIW